MSNCCLISTNLAVLRTSIVTAVIVTENCSRNNKDSVSTGFIVKEQLVTEKLLKRNDKNDKKR